MSYPYLDEYIERTKIAMTWVSADNKAPSTEMIKELAPKKRMAMLRTVMGEVRPEMIKRVLREKGPKLSRTPMKVGKGAQIPMRKSEIQRLPMEQRKVLLENCLDAMDRKSIGQVVHSVEADTGEQLAMQGFFQKSALFGGGDKEEDPGRHPLQLAGGGALGAGLGALGLREGAGYGRSAGQWGEVAEKGMDADWVKKLDLGRAQDVMRMRNTGQIGDIVGKLKGRGRLLSGLGGLAAAGGLGALGLGAMKGVENLGEQRDEGFLGLGGQEERGLLDRLARGYRGE